MRNLNYRTMATAMQKSDSRYDGTFYVGVHSTGIYCLPSCKARLPKLENVRFYATREAAIAVGLRGCKRCRSERFPDVLPEWLHDVLGYMRANRAERLNEDMLIRLTGVDISTVRRYFKDHLNITPLAFHRKLRLDHARQLIESGTDTTQAGFECGWESTSGFRSAFVRQFGKPPGSFYAGR